MLCSLLSYFFLSSIPAPPKLPRDRKLQRIDLRLQTFRVPREERRPADVVELQEQHEDTFQADASSTVRSTAHAESVNVGLHAVGVDTLVAHLLAEQSRVVNTLSAGKDFFASHEEVVGVGKRLSISVWLVEMILGGAIDKRSEGAALTGSSGSGMV